MRNRQSTVTGSLIAVVMFFAFGGIMIFIGWPMVVEAKASKSWPTTTGTITVSKVHTSYDSDSREKLYSHHIEYTYEVDGVQHTGHRVQSSDGGSSGFHMMASQIVSRYPVGSKTDVFYNPDVHEVALLEPGASWKTYLLFGSGCFCVFVGLVVAKDLLIGLFKGLLALLKGLLVVGVAVTSREDSVSAKSKRAHGPTKSTSNPSSMSSDERRSDRKHQDQLEEDDGIKIL